MTLLKKALNAYNNYCNESFGIETDTKLKDFHKVGIYFTELYNEDDVEESNIIFQVWYNVDNQQYSVELDDVEVYTEKCDLEQFINEMESVCDNELYSWFLGKLKDNFIIADNYY